MDGGVPLSSYDVTFEVTTVGDRGAIVEEITVEFGPTVQNKRYPEQVAESVCRTFEQVPRIVNVDVLEVVKHG